jgi:hypothetical protein
MCVLSPRRLAEVMSYFERNCEASSDAGSARLLLGALRHEELAEVAVRVGVPVEGRFFDLLTRLRARCV